MEHTMAVKLSNFLLSNKIIPEEYYEVYVYGNELLLSFAFSTSIILLIGLLLNRFIQTLLFLLIFILVRRYTGGYHANTYFMCKLATVTTYLSVLALSEYTSIKKIHILALLVVGLAIIISMCPIENPNKPISANQRKRNKITGLALFSLILFFSGLLQNRQTTFGNSIFYSLLSIILLMIIAKIQCLFENRGGVK